MTGDKLLWWEKLPIIGLFLAQGLYVWRWYTGFTAPPEVIATAGIFAVAAIDGAMVATVMGMRQGRRSRASVAAIVATALFGALVALDLYGAISGLSAWLHAGFAVVIVSYLLHLAAPVRVVVAEAVAHARAEAEQAKALYRQMADEALTLRERLADLEAQLNENDGALLVGGVEWTALGLSKALGVPETTLRRKLKAAGGS